ncbi:MAG: hypothetical protein K6E33_02820, partial [Lachnospiraceae bacterium]|nr:hypothetical protein [Lachnospiraceae bacterium]
VTVSPVPTKAVTYITKGKAETIKFPRVKNSKADLWSSSEPDVAEVVGSGPKMNGKVTAKAWGTSDITCSYNGILFETTVCAEDPLTVFDGKEYTDNNGKADMTVGEIKQFGIKNIHQTANYKSSKPKVVFIDENGCVYARSKGQAVISTKVNNKTYKIKITVKEN